MHTSCAVAKLKFPTLNFSNKDAGISLPKQECPLCSPTTFNAKRALKIINEHKFEMRNSKIRFLNESCDILESNAFANSERFYSYLDPHAKLPAEH